MGNNLIDTRGLSCPEPVLKTRQAMVDKNNSVIRILVDTEVARDNIRNQAEQENFSFSLEKQGEDYLITLKRRD